MFCLFTLFNEIVICKDSYKNSNQLNTKERGFNTKSTRLKKIENKNIGKFPKNKNKNFLNCLKKSDH